jgi:hypothetical protein
VRSESGCRGEKGTELFVPFFLCRNAEAARSARVQAKKKGPRLWGVVRALSPSIGHHYWGGATGSH